MSTYISISEMAKLHGITRQTLIHYDNIDLFKPAKVDTNGYRYFIIVNTRYHIYERFVSLNRWESV